MRRQFWRHLAIDNHGHLLQILSAVSLGTRLSGGVHGTFKIARQLQGFFDVNHYDDRLVLMMSL
jgi:hypothetical protein